MPGGTRPPGGLIQRRCRPSCPSAPRGRAPPPSTTNLKNKYYPAGLVANSNFSKKPIASARAAPHISCVGRKLRHTAGRSGRPKIAQRRSGNSCTQGTPAGLPFGMPGIGEEILGAIQHAPHWDRQSIPSGNAASGQIQSFLTEKPEPGPSPPSALAGARDSGRGTPRLSCKAPRDSPDAEIHVPRPAGS